MFPQFFFPNLDPLTGTLVAFASFGAGFLARPLGGIVLGHFGDRLGRRKILILTLILATFGIVIGVWLLVSDTANVLVAVVVAFIVSGLGSYFLLNGQREAFAQRVEVRAARAAKAFDELKAKEDAD